MESKIIVDFSNGVSCDLTSDTPDIMTLIETIKNNRESINVSAISVKCENVENFDAVGFKTVLVDCVTNYLELVKVNVEKYKDCIDQTNLSET